MRGDQTLKLLILIPWIGNSVIAGEIHTESYEYELKPQVVTTYSNKPSSTGRYAAGNYGVLLSKLTGFKMNIVGQGIKDEVHFNQNDDITIYKNKLILIVGKKVYSDKPNSMIVINNDQCMEREYSDGELIIATRMQPKDCVAIKKKMAKETQTYWPNGGTSNESEGMDEENVNVDVPEEEEIKSEEMEGEKDTDVGGYIDFTATNVDIPQYFAKNWGDNFDNRRIQILGKGILDDFLLDTYTMHSVKNLVIGKRYYSNRPNSLIEVIEDGSCVERKYRHGTLVSRTEPVTREECTRVKKALAEAYLYIKSGAWKTDGKGNTVQNFRPNEMESSPNNIGGTDKVSNGKLQSANGNRYGVAMNSGMYNTAAALPTPLLTSAAATAGKPSTKLGANRAGSEGLYSNQPSKPAVRPSVAVSKPAVTADKPSSKGGNYVGNYGVLLTIFTGFKVKINGQGIKDEVVLTPFDDAKIYKNKGNLLVGDKIYSDKPNSLIVINNDQCMERKYVDEELSIATKLQQEDCKVIKQKMANEKRTNRLRVEGSNQGNLVGIKGLYSIQPSVAAGKSAMMADTPSKGDYYVGNYGVHVSNFRGVKVNINGQGIKDKVELNTDDDATIYKNKGSLVVGKTIFSDKPNSLIVINNFRCMERKYIDEELSMVTKLQQKDCEAIKKKMAKEKQTYRPNGEALNQSDMMDDGSVEEEKIQSEEEEIQPQEEEEETEQEDTDVGDFIDVEGLYSNQPSKPAVRPSVAVSKPAVTADKPSSKGGNYVGNYGVLLTIFTGFKVKINGQGIKDEVVLTPFDDAKIYKNKGNLLVGDKIYSDKPNSLIVINNDQCMERKYVDEELSIATKLQQEDCKVIKQKMANEKRTNRLRVEGSNQGNLVGIKGLYSIQPSVAAGKSAMMADTPSKGDYYVGNYGVHVSNFRGVKVNINGQGIKDKVELNTDDDATIYKNKGSLVVGKTIFSDKPNSLIVINNFRCMERKYIDEELSMVTKLQQKDCEAIKKKMAKEKQTYRPNGEALNQSDMMDDGSVEEEKIQSEEEEIQPQEEEEETEQEDTDVGDFIDVEADATDTLGGAIKKACETDVNIPRYYAKNWADIFDNRRIEIYGYGIIDNFFDDTYTMYSDKKLVIGKRYYSDRPNSLIEVSKDGSCVERKYQDGTLVSRTGPVTRKECTRVKKALDDAYAYIKSGAWKRDRKGNTVQNFH